MLGHRTCALLRDQTCALLKDQTCAAGTPDMTCAVLGPGPRAGPRAQALLFFNTLLAGRGVLVPPSTCVMLAFLSDAPSLSLKVTFADACLPVGCLPTCLTLVFLSDACLPVGCLSTSRMLVCLSDACLPVGCSPTCQMLVYLSDACLPVGCKYDVNAGPGPVPGPGPGPRPGPSCCLTCFLLDEVF